MAETKPGTPPEGRKDNTPDAGKQTGGSETGLKSRRRKEIKPDGTVVIEDTEYYEGSGPAEKSEKAVVKIEDAKKPAGEVAKTTPDSSGDKTKQPEAGKENKEGTADVGKEVVETLKQNKDLTDEVKKIIEAHEAQIIYEVNQKKTLWQKAGDVLRPGAAGVVTGIAMKTVANIALRKGVTGLFRFGVLNSTGAGIAVGAAVGAGWEYALARHSETKRLQSLDNYRMLLKNLDKMSSLEKVERLIAIKEALKNNKIKFESSTQAQEEMLSFQAEFKALSAFVEEGKWKNETADLKRLDALLKVVKSSSGEAIAQSILPESEAVKKVPSRMKLFAGAYDKFTGKNKEQKVEKNPDREKEVAKLLAKFHLVRDKKKIRRAVLRGAITGGLGAYAGGVVSEYLGLGQFISDVSGQNFGGNAAQAAQLAALEAGQSLEPASKAAESVAEKTSNWAVGKVVGWVVAVGVPAAGTYVALKKSSKAKKDQESFRAVLGLAGLNSQGGGGESAEKKPEQENIKTAEIQKGMDINFIRQETEEVLKTVNEVLAKNLDSLSEDDLQNASQDLNYLDGILISVGIHESLFSARDKKKLKKLQKQMQFARAKLISLRKQREEHKSAEPVAITEAKDSNPEEKAIGEISSEIGQLEALVEDGKKDGWAIYNFQKAIVYAIYTKLDKLNSDLGGQHALAPKILEQYRRLEDLYERSYKARRILEVNKYTGVLNDGRVQLSPSEFLSSAKEKGVKEWVMYMAEGYGGKRKEATPQGILNAVNFYIDKLSEQRRAVVFTNEDRTNLPAKVVKDYEAMYELEQLLSKYEQSANVPLKKPAPKPKEAKVPESKQEIISRVVEMVPALLGYSSDQALEVLKTNGPMGLAKDLFASANPSLEDKLRALNGFCYDLESLPPLSPDELKVLDPNNVEQYDTAMRLKAKLVRFLEDWRIPLYKEAIQNKIISEQELGGPEDGEPAKKVNSWLDLLQEDGGPLNTVATSTGQADFLRRGIREVAKSEGQQRAEDLKLVFVDILSNDSASSESPQQAASKINKFKGELKILFGKDVVDLAYNQAKKQIKKK